MHKLSNVAYNLVNISKNKVLEIYWKLSINKVDIPTQTLYNKFHEVLQKAETNLLYVQTHNVIDI